MEHFKLTCNIEFNTELSTEYFLIKKSSASKYQSQKSVFAYHQEQGLLQKQQKTAAGSELGFSRQASLSKENIEH